MRSSRNVKKTVENPDCAFGIAWFLHEFETLAFQHVAISIFYCVALETENSVRRFVAQTNRYKTLKILGQDWYTGLKPAEPAVLMGGRKVSGYNG